MKQEKLKDYYKKSKGQNKNTKNCVGNLSLLVMHN